MTPVLIGAVIVILPHSVSSRFHGSLSPAFDVNKLPYIKSIYCYLHFLRSFKNISALSPYFLKCVVTSKAFKNNVQH